MKCCKCKKEIPSGSPFCNWCGARQDKFSRRKDGLLQKSVVIDGKRKFFYAKTEKELIKKIANYQKEQETVSSKSFSYYADLLEKSWDNLAHNSLKGYKPALKRCTEKFGDTPVNEITALQVMSYLNSLGRTYAQKTVNTHRSMMMQVFDLALLDGAIQTNPAIFKQRTTGKKSVERKPASSHDIKIIEEFWHESDIAFMAYFILHTGLRRGEALALQYKDIDITARRVYVRKSVYYIGTQPYIKEPKTEAGKRVVILPECVAEKLKTGKPDAYVFGWLPKQQVERAWGEFCAAHGMAERTKDSSGHYYHKCTTTFHMLRHSYATSCYEKGIDKMVVQEMMGHTSYGMTEGYTHILEASLKAAEDKLNRRDGEGA